MENCIFCDIASKILPKEFLYEDNELMAFTDIKPLAPVHILIVPKEHIASINSLKESHKNLIGNMFLLAKEMAKDYEISEGYKITFNTGRKGGQLIDHLHLHLMGGWKEDQ